MTKKKEFSFRKMIINLLMVLPALSRLITNFSTLIEVEVASIKRNVLRLFILYLTLMSLLTATWLCICTMLTIYLQSLQLSLLTALFIIFLINILFIMVIVLCLFKTKNNLSLQRTRQLLRDIKQAK